MMALELVTNWEFISDTVMGGVSSGQISTEQIAGRPATRLTGEVSLENNGGFVQMAFDINEDGSSFDASAFNAIEIDVFGNDEEYDLRLRTSDLTRPWQSFRAPFFASPKWATIRLHFDEFVPHKTEAEFDPRHLRRIGVLGIGRVFKSDLCVAAARLVE